VTPLTVTLAVVPWVATKASSNSLAVLVEKVALVMLVLAVDESAVAVASIWIDTTVVKLTPVKAVPLLLTDWLAGEIWNPSLVGVTV